MRVTETIGPAWDTMKRLLFRPFHLGTWFAFGLMFGLQSCTEGGGGNSFRLPDLDKLGIGGDSGESSLNLSTDAIANVLPGDALARSTMGSFGAAELALIGAIVLVVGIPVFVLLYWIGSRGQMMAIRAVATGNSDVGEAWRVTEASGNRMFRFHLALVGIALLVFVPIVGVGAAIVLPVLRAPEDSPGFLMVLLPLMVLALAAMLPFAMAKSLATNFVAPLMLKFEIGSREAWRRFWAIGKLHIGSIVVFWLVGFGFAIVAALASVVAGLVTCCLGFLPILHQTIMAPYYVFERAWTLEILASMSPEFDMRAVPIEPYDGGAPPPFGYGQHGYGPPGNEWRGGFGGPPSPPAGGFGGPRPAG